MGGSAGSSTAAKQSSCLNALEEARLTEQALRPSLSNRRNPQQSSDFVRVPTNLTVQSFGFT
jgi:hypothetical protein